MNCGTALPDGARFCLLCGAPARGPVERPAAQQEDAPTCRIRLWRGYVKAEFYVELVDPDSGEMRVERSRTFRWRRDEPPPPDRPDVESAWDRLVARLEALGWRRVGRPTPWYAQRFAWGGAPVELVDEPPAQPRLTDLSQEAL